MEDSFWFYSPTTENNYRIERGSIAHAGVSNSYPTIEEAEQVLARFVQDEWAAINAIIAAGSKGWTLGLGYNRLYTEQEVQVSAQFGIDPGNTLCGSRPLTPLLSMAQALHDKKEELEKKLKTAIRYDHPMVVMAARMSGHLSHGWAFFDGENLSQIEESMDKSEEGRENDPFGAGLRPPLYMRGVKEKYPFAHDAEIAMGGTSGTGRYDWYVTAKGDLYCDICRPAGVAIHIHVVHLEGGGEAVEIKKGNVPFEDRHLEHAEGVIAACGGVDFAKSAMTQSLLKPDEFDSWQQRRDAEFEKRLEAEKAE